MAEDLKQRIVQFITDRTAKGKGLNSMRDIAKAHADASRHEVRDAVTELIDGGQLKYWSSGSTTYITLVNFEPGSGAGTAEADA
jgi:hypothetical protein